jgi:hypothetical protein
LSGKENNMASSDYKDVAILGMPNILVRIEIDTVLPDANFGATAEMTPYLLALATKKPNWRFVGVQGWHIPHDEVGKTYEAYKFNVWEGKSKLGKIYTDRGRARKTTYYAENNRITQKRDRGSAMFTTKLDKAIKNVCKEFYPATTTEIMASARSKSQGVMQDIVGDKMRAFDNRVTRILRGLESYLLDNWETMSVIAAKNCPKEVSELPLALEEKYIAVGVKAAFDSSGGTLVALHGSEYVTAHGTYTTDTLPVHIKQGVGMLKLVDAGQCVRDVGFRVDADTFFVIGVIQ